MTREQLMAEAKRLRAGIRKHRDSSGHELCWHHPALWGLLPERTDPVPTTLRLHHRKVPVRSSRICVKRAGSTGFTTKSSKPAS